MDTVKIFDTTCVSEKLEIAEQLARLGVDVIEAGSVGP
jgi:isopropylmalate/homocitrate/citramalate synthase